jgi:hypothetical protein
VLHPAVGCHKVWQLPEPTPPWGVARKQVSRRRRRGEMRRVTKTTRKQGERERKQQGTRLPHGRQLRCRAHRACAAALAHGRRCQAGAAEGCLFIMLTFSVSAAGCENPLAGVASSVRISTSRPPLHPAPLHSPPPLLPPRGLRPRRPLPLPPHRFLRPRHPRPSLLRGRTLPARAD